MLAGSRLRAVHARVYGTTRHGRQYTAEDPHLLAWVHACLVASFLEIVTRGGLSLTPRQQDDYIYEQVRTAMLVGLEPEEVPHDRASLVAYFRRLRPALAVTPQPPRQPRCVVAASGRAAARAPPGTVPPGPTSPGSPSPRCHRGHGGSTPCRSCPGLPVSANRPPPWRCASCGRR